MGGAYAVSRSSEWPAVQVDVSLETAKRQVARGEAAPPQRSSAISEREFILVVCSLLIRSPHKVRTSLISRRQDAGCLSLMFLLTELSPTSSSR